MKEWAHDALAETLFILVGGAKQRCYRMCICLRCSAMSPSGEICSLDLDTFGSAPRLAAVRDRSKHRDAVVDAVERLLRDAPLANVEEAAICAAALSRH